MTTSNTLVAYFSATGTTKKIAETLALVAQADLFEIVPKKLYTKEDLDWHNLNSRSSVECNDTTARPEIATRVPNMDNYQNIFIGFPIWWYAAPRIIETFLESYNMENKFIIPFCTSGSSDIGDSAKLLEHCSKGKIVTGARLPVDISKGKLVQWANMQKFYK
ncbi:MAG: flavodoxin [Dialister pneumosintes]